MLSIDRLCLANKYFREDIIWILLEEFLCFNDDKNETT